jgi:hypothetical protein
MDMNSKELESLMLQTYGRVVVNFAYVQEYRDLLENEYRPSQRIEALITDLLNAKDGKALTGLELSKLKYVANEAKSNCASYFSMYYDDNYVQPASGVQDIDEHNCEFVSNFNAYFKTEQGKEKGVVADVHEHKYQTVSCYLPIIMWFGSFQIEGEWLYIPKKSSIDFTNQSARVSGGSAGRSKNGRAAVSNEDNISVVSSQVSAANSSTTDRKNCIVPDSTQVLELNKTLKVLLHQITSAAHNERKVNESALVVNESTKRCQYQTSQTSLAQMLEIGIRAPGTAPHDVIFFQEQLSKSIHEAIQFKNANANTYTGNTVTVNTTVVSGLQNNKRKNRVPEVIAATPVPAEIVDVTTHHDDLELMDYDDDCNSEDGYLQSTVEEMDEMAGVDEDYIMKKFPKDAENIKVHNQALDFYQRTIAPTFRTVSITFGSLEEEGIYKIKAPSSYEDSQEEFTDVGNDCSIPLHNAIVYVTKKFNIGKRTSTFYEGIVSNTAEYFLVQLIYEKHKDYLFHELHEIIVEEETISRSVNINNDSQNGKKKKSKN